MNHKRRRPKHQRAGCLDCKPWKDERGEKARDGRTSSRRREIHLAADMKKPLELCAGTEADNLQQYLEELRGDVPCEHSYDDRDGYGCIECFKEAIRSRNAA